MEELKTSICRVWELRSAVNWDDYGQLMSAFEIKFDNNDDNDNKGYLCEEANKVV